MALSNPRLHFVEQGGQIIDDTTVKVVGLSFSESMPIERLKNGPYDVNQHRYADTTFQHPEML